MFFSELERWRNIAHGDGEWIRPAVQRDVSCQPWSRDQEGETRGLAGRAQPPGATVDDISRHLPAGTALVFLVLSLALVYGWQRRYGPSGGANDPTGELIYWQLVLTLILLCGPVSLAMTAAT